MLTSTHKRNSGLNKQRKKWRPPRIGRANYDSFRLHEVVEVIDEIKLLVDMERFHERHKGKRGRRPARKQDILKSILFLEKLKCPICESGGLLQIFKYTLGLKTVYKPRTLYKYRASPVLTVILEKLVLESALPEWVNEDLAGADATGLPHSKGKTWLGDKSNPNKYREYDKVHAIMGLRSLVIPAVKITRGTWHDSPQFEYIVNKALPQGDIDAVTADSGYISRDNCELVREHGATPYIMPKENAVFRPEPTDAYEKSVLFATRFPNRFHETYRWRTKCESAFNACKNATGERLRGRTPTSRRNEALCKIIIHNIRMVVMCRYAE